MCLSDLIYKDLIALHASHAVDEVITKKGMYSWQKLLQMHLSNPQTVKVLFMKFVTYEQTGIQKPFKFCSIDQACNRYTFFMITYQS